MPVDGAILHCICTSAQVLIYGDVHNRLKRAVCRLSGYHGIERSGKSPTRPAPIIAFHRAESIFPWYDSHAEMRIFEATRLLQSSDQRALSAGRADDLTGMADLKEWRWSRATCEHLCCAMQALWTQVTSDVDAVPMMYLSSLIARLRRCSEETWNTSIEGNIHGTTSVACKRHSWGRRTLHGYSSCAGNFERSISILTELLI